ncbi:HlyD family efflux transporter periplasmic adaptor subunit [Rhizobium laguerreae]|uniref:HlyD family efflux transporter periplasmic adaptor subunit n=1 Tax=Rhizobium laguerreae TaxID=1076926 RepID=UPI00147964F5|nr:HlyD family efflux transporter periplasmic adaptor subunit [Rhizobium laguerreae]
MVAESSAKDGTIHRKCRISRSGSIVSIKASELTPVMRIVPADLALSIEAYLPNGDIGFVRTGQAVSVKLEAFQFTRYGTVPGVINHIAKDAIPEPDA